MGDFTVAMAGVEADGWVDATLEPPSDDWRLWLVRAVDQEGRELELITGGTPNRGQFGGQLALRPETKSVDLTFGLQPRRYAEVVAEATGAEAP